MARLSKVEISGVNTSKLPVLTREEAKALFLEARAGSEAARQKLIQGNLRLVLSVIKKFDSRGENPDDLFQVGCVGLIKGIDNFNVELDVFPSTYLVPMIVGEIRRHLRDDGLIRVSRGTRHTGMLLMRERARIAAEEGVAFLPSDFKKKGGQVRRDELVSQYCLYCQDYCGCIYSYYARHPEQKR